jgi:histidyl-tRNA synthetase
MYKRIAGTRDILPDEAAWWQKIEGISRKIFSLYGYKEIRTALIEEACLFNRSLGESSELVQKQMFLIKNKEDIYALRPEGTAPIVRSYLENNLDKAGGFLKLYYMGPMFRLERPQKGRFRQFNHIGCEAIGSYDANLDVEVIALADNLLRAFSIDGYKIKINSLGCAKDKLELSAILHKSLKDKLNTLCRDCKVRFKKNALRILDCKNQACRELVSKIDTFGGAQTPFRAGKKYAALSINTEQTPEPYRPEFRSIDIGASYLCPECAGHFAKVRIGLDLLKVNYEVAPLLVRGLDYYTRTVFEITRQDLGAQDALGAGGRYDTLVKELGGPEMGAIGFAFGVERLLLAQGAGRKAQGENNLVYIITLGEEAKRESLRLLNDLRKAGISVDTDYENKSLKAAMRLANDLGAKYVLILGEDELKKNVVTLKDMGSGEQKEVNPKDLITGLTKNLKLKTF